MLAHQDGSCSRYGNEGYKFHNHLTIMRTAAQYKLMFVLAVIFILIFGKDVLFMKGSVRKRGSMWSYCFDLGTVDGKRKRMEKGGFRTKKEAETALASAINEYNNGGQVFTPSDITVSDYLDQWYELYCKTNLKYNTYICQNNTNRRHALQCP